MAKILVTGAAGFIGYHTSERLLARGDEVVGLDNLNDYYDPTLKAARLARLTGTPGFTFVRMDLGDRAGIEQLFAAQRFDKVINLAAQAGVRYSLTNPHTYIDSNLVGFLHILEGCRHHGVQHLTYASSSSVYGANTAMPFSVHQNVDHPLSLYAATKKANELMAHTYSHLYGLPTTGLRFFTVYGPWGRPDMAMFLFTKAILEGRPIDVFNHGKMRRDFTFIDDIVEGVIRTNPVELMHLIGTLEQALGRTAEKNMLPIQPGDVPATYADVAALEQDVGFAPKTSIESGVARFVEWYRSYYGA
jgi:UDP-glucuronate 4-epimerase